MDIPTTILKILTAAMGSLGFSILFYVKPRRLPLTTLGGILSCAVYLLVQHFTGGELIPNLVGAFVGGVYSEIMARATKAPVPVYLLPSIIPLVPGGLLYRTMNQFIRGAYGEAGRDGLTALAVAIGIAGGIMAASILGMLYARMTQWQLSKKQGREEKGAGDKGRFVLKK